MTQSYNVHDVFHQPGTLAPLCIVGFDDDENINGSLGIIKDWTQTTVNLYELQRKFDQVQPHNVICKQWREVFMFQSWDQQRDDYYFNFHSTLQSNMFSTLPVSDIAKDRYVTVFRDDCKHISNDENCECECE